ncbi:hypothetical protein E3E22_07395 [Thermococcus sp. MV5]|uniref:hypothetical protein n=1 Tax=Thermococcus sp. MV5 TaxID=1638272 RepID=UPI00143A19CF|nr:hypothetical protein [Thermococcus sp. MV5]NJE26441.1 hypothetical protein [Thermococcus sp. MV5]
MQVVIAIDESNNATAIIVVNYDDLHKLTREFRGIKHFREVKRNRNQYLKNEFRPRLEKVMRKYYLKPRYYAKINHYFWEDVEYYARFGLEIIVDDKLWRAVVDRFGDMQISIIKEGDIAPAIEKLKQKLWEAQKEKDVIMQKQIERELEYYLQRKILITIADNYVNLRRRGIKH